MGGTELAELADSGAAMLGASADPGRVPEVFRIWGATHDAASDTVRAVVAADAGQTLETVTEGSRLSVTFTDIHTFRSVQAKGHATGPPRPPGRADIAVMRRYEEVFARQMAKIGHPDRLVDKLRPTAVFVLTMVVDECFDQTPGPGAGRPLGAS